MLTVEEYISQMKKRDKLDEFNFRNHAGNMASVISYVMEYFNNYLNPEAYHYEQIKLDQTVEKIRQEIEKNAMQMEDWNAFKRLSEYADELESYIGKLEDLEEKELIQKYIALLRGKMKIEHPIKQIIAAMKELGDVCSKHNQDETVE